MNRQETLLSACIATLLSAGAAYAQEASSASQLEEIVVTAEKRELSLQRVAAAVTAVSGDNLAAQGITDQTRLAKSVPGLVLGDQGGTGRYFIRGVGQTLGSNNAQPGVSVNMNGVYWSREMGMTPLFDLERVEVLPGPQGTLWGRNAAGGAINFISKRPVHTFGGSVTLEAGSDNLLHPTVVANIPVAEGLAIRIAGDANSRDGYLSNGANDKDDTAVRVSALYDGVEGLSVFLSGFYAYSGGIGNQAVLFREDGGRVMFRPVGADPWTRTFATNGLYQDAYTRLIQAEIAYEITDDLTLTYVPGYVDYDGKRLNQFSGTLPTIFNNYVRQISHELRLDHAGDKLNWVVGAYHHTGEHDLKNVVGALLPNPVGRVQFHNELTSYALFGEGTYSLTDNLRFTVGGRYSNDEFNGFAFLSAPPFSEARPLIGPGRKSNDNVDYKIGVQYDVTPAAMLYGTIQTGYLMGGFTQDGRLFRPETLIAYTAGAKSRFLDGRLQLNLEAYYYDYQDYQLQYAQGTTFLTDNEPARVYGVQIDLAARPWRGGTFTLNALASRARIETDTRYVRDGVLQSIDDFQLPDAPDFTVTTAYEHRFDLPSGAGLTARGQIYYNSGYWMVFTHDLNTRQKAFTSSDLSLTYEEPDGRWQVGVWVRNIENEDVYVGGNKPAPLAPVASYIQPPRTYGVRLNVDF